MDNKHYNAHYLNNTFEVMKGIKTNSYQLLQDSGDTIVDIGCGTGMDVYQLAVMQSSKKIIGVDHDNKLISHATSTFSAPNISFVNGSVLNLPFSENSISAFRAERVFQHILEDKKGFQQIFSALEKDGIFVILETDWSSINFPSFPKNLSEKFNHFFANIKVVNGNICNNIVSKLMNIGFTITTHEIQKLHTNTYQEATQFLMIDQIASEIYQTNNLLTEKEIHMSKKILNDCKEKNKFVASLNFHTLKALK